MLKVLYLNFYRNIHTFCTILASSFLTSCEEHIRMSTNKDFASLVSGAGIF